MNIIDSRKVIPNTDRKFGSAKNYVPAVLIRTDGTRQPILLTRHQLNEARYRAEQNEEDIPKLSIWQRFWLWLVY